MTSRTVPQKTEPATILEFDKKQAALATTLAQQVLRNNVPDEVPVHLLGAAKVAPREAAPQKTCRSCSR